MGTDSREAPQLLAGLLIRLLLEREEEQEVWKAGFPF